MTVLLSIIWFLIIISVIVVVHEFGHFIFAKIFKTRVEEFSIGFGPALFKIPGKETTFRFNIVPLGGYVRLAGEEVLEEGYEDTDPALFYNKKPFQKFLIAFAGPLFSFLLGYFLFVGIAGAYPGDIIKKANGDYVFNPSILELEIASGKPLELTVIRNGEEVNVTLNPELTNERAIFTLQGIEDTEFLTLKNKEIVSLNGEEDLYIVMSRLESGDPIEIQLEDGTIIEGKLSQYSYFPPTYETGIVYATFSNVIAEGGLPHGNSGSNAFQPGDKIIEINGVDINNGSDLQNVIYRTQLNTGELMFAVSGKEIINEYKPFKDNTLEVLVERNGQTIIINLSKEEFLDFIVQPGVLEAPYENIPKVLRLLLFQFNGQII